MPSTAASAATVRDWRSQLAAALWTATVLMVVVVVSRRAGGSFDEALHPALALLIVAVLTTANLTAALLMKSAAGGSRRTPQRPWTRKLSVLLVTIVPPLGLGACLLPVGSVGGWSALLSWGLISTIGLLLAGDAVRMESTASDLPDGQGAHAVESAWEMEAGLPDEADSADCFGECETDEQPFSQSMSRLALPDGGETIEGTVTLAFAAGQQISVVHLPFCPPLAARPEVDCHLLDDRPVRLRVTAAHHYGARVEAKRIGSATAADEVLVGYVVTAANPRTRAA